MENHFDEYIKRLNQPFYFFKIPKNRGPIAWRALPLLVFLYGCG
jgi:hypothetical protein